MRRALLASLFSAGCIAFTERSVVVREGDGMVPFGPLVAGVTLEQEFLSDGRPFDGILPLLATYSGPNRSVVSLALERASDGGWSAVGHDSAGIFHFSGKTVHEFRFPRQRPEAGARYRFRLASSDADGGEALTTEIARAAGVPGLALYRNGALVGGGIPFALVDHETLPLRAAIREARTRLRGIVPPSLFLGAESAGVAFPALVLVLVARLAWLARRPRG